MSGLLCGPHRLTDKALRTRQAWPMLANASGTDANFIVVLHNDVSRPISKTDGSRCIDLSEVSACSDGMSSLVGS
jgi:hypothetical protein